MTISKPLSEAINSASWIRRMFEAGIALKAEVGAENVFDFSLGNPPLEPPKAVSDALRELASTNERGTHRYMPNNGYPSTREKVAQALSSQEDIALSADDIVMTVGAAGGLNVALRSLLDPMDEVIILAPYFVEYTFYTQFNGGVSKIVDTTDEFDLDIEAINAAITEKTKVIIVNTPNNPTGVIYSAERMNQLADLLTQAEKKYGHPIYILADTPYAKLTYDGAKNPPLLNSYPHTIIAHSHSKDLGLAGERIGYLAINPNSPYRNELRSAMTFCNRALGFVNAPALMQRTLERSLDASVDINVYAKLKDKMVNGLHAFGYDFVVPQGAFYIFAKTPIEDDVEFTQRLKDENTLVVPGRGFGRKGHIRIAFCVSDETVEKGLPRFEKVLKSL